MQTWLKETRAVRVLLLTTAMFLAGVVTHAPYWNGSRYWSWSWQDLAPAAFLPSFLPALGLLIVAQWWQSRSGKPEPHGTGLPATGQRSVVGPLFLLVLAFYFLEFGALLEQPGGGIDRIRRVVEHPYATSYFNDAMRLRALPAASWLAHYHQLMPDMYLHSMTKPAGPVLYYWLLIRCPGLADSAALVGGLGIALMAGLAIPAAYILASRCGQFSTETAFLAATLQALAPGLVLFCPEFDQLYPLITCALTLAWLRAMHTRRHAWAIPFGLTFGVATFFAYNFLVLGVLLGAISLGALKMRWLSLARATQLAVSATASAVALYVLMGWTTGYDALAVFRTALRNQDVLQAIWKRPWLAAIPFDLFDFALGSGWLPAGLALRELWRTRDEWRRNSAHPAELLAWLKPLFFLQVAVVALSGLLRCETARVWIFLQPLLLIPAAAAMASWTLRFRVLFLVCAWLLLLSVAANYSFIGL